MRSTLLFLALCGLVVACGEDPVPTPVAVLPVQGAAIDGSEDPVAPEPVTEVAEAPAEPGPDVTSSAGTDPIASEGAGDDAADPGAPDELTAAESEGPVEVSFWDLSLYELDVDAMLDAMLHPDEYDEEELEELAFPPEIGNLDGQEIVVQGYMIPGKMILGNVRDFMLVRDLLGCCFGAQPMPDEWIDVVMHEEADAAYHQYIPVKVTGTLTLGGEQDKAGFARGVYKLLATEVLEPD